jgi:hypothetical protein
MIGIISDTHDSLVAIRQAVKIFNSEKVELVVHAGDYVAPFTCSELKKLDSKFLGVFGNNDGERRGLREKYLKLGTELSDFAEFEFAGRRIAVYHGTVKPVLDALVDSGNYDVVITGHSHKAEIAMKNGTLLLNPGEACGYVTGKKTVCVLEVEKLRARLIDLG